MNKTPRKTAKEDGALKAKKSRAKHKEAMEFARRSFREYVDTYRALAKS